MKITKKQAQEFYRDLCGTVYGDPRKNSQGVMSVALIADHMGMTEARADEFCRAMVYHGITERSCGKYIV